jgi:Lon protease-like protein
VVEPLALFPLPGVVFFPGTLLPLHVFETRYRKMTLDVLAGSRCMAVVSILDPPESDDLGQPKIASIAGAGEIVRHDPLPDGRHNIVLMGRARVRLEELAFEPPYRRARATVLESGNGRISDIDLAALSSTATRFAGMLRRRDTSFDFSLPPTRDASALTDAIANALVIEPSERQRLLETLNPVERARRCAEMLAVQELSMRLQA